MALCKVGISRNKTLLAPFDAFSPYFSMGRKNEKSIAIFIGGPMGPIFTRFGPMGLVGVLLFCRENDCHQQAASAAIHPRWGNM